MNLMFQFVGSFVMSLVGIILLLDSISNKFLISLILSIIISLLVLKGGNEL